MRPALVRPSANVQVAKPSAVGTSPWYTVHAIGPALESATPETRLGANGRHATVAAAHPSHVTRNGDTRASTGFCTTTAEAYASAATRHRRMPSPTRDADSAVATPIVKHPANATAHPAKSPGGKPSPRNAPAMIAIRIGLMFTSIAAVPASTCRSAAFSVTL